MLTHGAQNLDQIAGKAIENRYQGHRELCSISAPEDTPGSVLRSTGKPAEGAGFFQTPKPAEKRRRKCPLCLSSFVLVFKGHAGTFRASLNRKEETMRVMVIVKATKNSEAGIMPSEELLAAMGKFNEELVKAGVMLAGEGLHPSSKGKRLRFSGGKKSVIDGPFTATNELIAGFWLWQVKSMEDAVEWVRRCPDPMPGEDAEIEIRPVFEAEDFGEEFTPELRAQEERLRTQLEQSEHRSGGRLN